LPGGRNSQLPELGKHTLLDMFRGATEMSFPCNVGGAHCSCYKESGVLAVPESSSMQASRPPTGHLIRGDQRTEHVPERSIWRWTGAESSLGLEHRVTCGMFSDVPHVTVRCREERLVPPPFGGSVKFFIITPDQGQNRTPVVFDTQPFPPCPHYSNIPEGRTAQAYISSVGCGRPDGTYTMTSTYEPGILEECSPASEKITIVRNP